MLASDKSDKSDKFYNTSLNKLIRYVNSDVLAIANAEMSRQIADEADRSLLAFESDEGGLENFDGQRLSQTGRTVEDGRLVRSRKEQVING